MVGYFLAGLIGGFMLGTVAGLLLMAWLTSGSDADDLQEAWNAGFVFGQMNGGEEKEREGS